MSNQNEAWDLYLKGNKLAEEQEIEKAIAAYKESINLYPNYEEVYNNLGVLYHDLGKHEDATSYFEQGIAIALQNNEEKTKAPFTSKELVTLLAALRLFQRTPSVKKQLVEYFEETEPLTASEIDELCQRLCCCPSKPPLVETPSLGERLTTLGEIEILLSEKYKERALSRIWASFPEFKTIEFEKVKNKDDSSTTIALTDIIFANGNDHKAIVKRMNLELVAEQYKANGEWLKFWQYSLLSMPPTEELVGRHERPDEVPDLLDVIEQVAELGASLAVD